MTSISKRPRIALVVPALDQGGGVPSVAKFIRRTILRDGRFDTCLVSLPMSSRDPSSTLIRNPRTWMRGIATRAGTFDSEPFVEVGAFLGDIEVMRYQPRAELAAAISQCDLIQVVAGSPAWANAVLGLGKPVVLQVATLIDVERRKYLEQSDSVLKRWRSVMTRLAGRLDTIALRSVDAVLVENPLMLARAESVSKNGRPLVRYAPPGVDTKLFRPATASDTSPIDRPYILCVGRLSDPRKNVGLLIEAYSRLPKNERPLLVLAGDDLPQELVKRQGDKLRITEDIRLILKPSINELARLYRHSQFFALPSDEEGFGMVVIEAMASGIPVVATRCGGPDGIITDGDDGFLVNRDDIDGMTQRLMLLSGDAALAAKVGQRARITVESKYSEDVAGRMFLSIYGMLLERRMSDVH